MISFLEGLNNQFIGKNYCYFNHLPSTNSFLMKDYCGGYQEGFLVIAGSQSSGRGREDRVWFSKEKGSLLFSIVLTPKKHPDHIPQLTQTIALAISRVIEKECSLNSEIKWPNDIFVNNKKICGILCEGKNIKNRLVIVAGVGLNVNILKDELPDNLKDIATSIQSETKKEWNLEHLLKKILYEIEQEYLKWTEGRFLEITEEISYRFYLKNKTIEVQTQDGLIKGKGIGINESGYLLVEENNRVHTILSGEIKKCS